MSDKCGECGRKEPGHERKKPEDRKEELLIAAIEVSKEKGYRQITRADVAERAGVSTSLIQFYFETVALLQRDIMHAAVEREVPEIVLQGLAVSDAAALDAPVKLRAEALSLYAAGNL